MMREYVVDFLKDFDYPEEASKELIEAYDTLIGDEYCKNELERLIKEGYITKEQGESINLNLVRKFLFSPLGKRMLKAEDIKKEYRFSVNIEAGIVREDLTEENKHHPVILQGAIDCYFLENGKMYIVDFKTDRVKDLSELVLEYGTQLKLYAKALKEISDYPLGGCYIFSLHRSESVEIEL